MLEKNNCGKMFCLDKAIHRSNIKIDEYGNGVDSVKREDRFPGMRMKEFKANHPFIYFIASVDKSEDDDNDDFYAQKLPTEILFAGIFG
uniref:Serpin domain-containing protein n=1 Tax=Panagrolaimus superbus TaxID=310955 RepID=A0A914YM31_9BILA